MPKHIVRLILVMVVGFTVFVATKVGVTAKSFGEFGHYRGDSVQEIAAPTPVYKTPAYCQLCHFDRHAEWHAGSHKTVICEVCHGPARNHPTEGKLPIPEYSITVCSACHDHMPTRPASFPQIEASIHMAGRGKAYQCIDCHNPHAPKETVDPEAPAPASDEAIPYESTSKQHQKT